MTPLSVAVTDPDYPWSNNGERSFANQQVADLLVDAGANNWISLCGDD